MPQAKRKTQKGNVAFSSKQKKAQLQQKRERKNGTSELSSSGVRIVSKFKSNQDDDVDVINEQPTTSAKYNPNRYRLVFKKEKGEEVQERIKLSYIPYKSLPEEELEVSYEDVFTAGSDFDMPKRPPWNFSFSREQLEMKEQKYFREYVRTLESKFGEHELSHYEMNLETWRQLWRVTEFSDIVLQVIDVRYSVYHFSPALYRYVTDELKKSTIVVLNKIDLVPAPLVLAWQEYFKKHFPMIKVMCFASYAGMILKDGKKGRRVGNLHMAIAGARHLLQICEEIVAGQVNLSSWKHKIDGEAAVICSSGDAYDDDDDFEEDSDTECKHRKKGDIHRIQNDTSYYEGKRYQDGVLTIGFVGHPNVGKSSFLNAICGKKVVSVSRTPGHTKHFQTIMLTKNVRLCDCPGLVFPSLVPKPIQVLMGCYPISQLREPYSAIKFLGERIPVHNILNIKHPAPENFEGTEVQWSSYDICEAWAIKRGFRTAKTSRPDVYRAANNILRMALDGRTMCLAFYPPDYTKQKVSWSTHPGLKDIVAVQAFRVKDRSEVSKVSAELNFIKVLDEVEEFCDTASGDEESSEGERGGDSEDSGDIPAPSNKFDLLNEEFN